MRKARPLRTWTHGRRPEQPEQEDMLEDAPVANGVAWPVASSRECVWRCGEPRFAVPEELQSGRVE